MKKLLTSLMLAIFTCMWGFPLIGCGTRTSGIDRNRTQIYINIPNFGFGLSWLDGVIAEFEKDYPKYQVINDPKKKDISAIDQDIKTGTKTTVYFASAPDFVDGFHKGLYTDLSDLVEMKPDGESGLTIGKKLNDYQTWKDVASIDGKGFYMLPYADSMSGFVYDHGFFVSKNWLRFADGNDTIVCASLDAQGITYTKNSNRLIFTGSSSPVNYNIGDRILRAGKDGKYGTYDDGQPETLAEWDVMVKTIASMANTYPFIYTGGFIDYTTEIFSSVFANYEGLDSAKIYFTHKGNYTFSTYMVEDGRYVFTPNATAEEITMANGYLVYEMPGLYKAYDFMNKYLVNESYVHPQANPSTTSHTDAQNLFLLGHRDPAKNPTSAMLIEGTWWENEARGMFNTIAKTEPDRGFGKRDYRFMVWPSIPGQKGANGDGSGTIMAARDTGAFAISAKASEEIIRMSKIFCMYTLKDKFLKDFTKMSGAVRPYAYNLSDEEKAQLTPFARNNYEMYYDTKNIKILRPNLLRWESPLLYTSNKGMDSWVSVLDEVRYQIPLNAVTYLKNAPDPAALAWAGMKAWASPTAWNGWLKEGGLS